MNLSPLDIRKQEFRKSMRGYEPKEVQDYLRMLAQEWSLLLEEQRRMQTSQNELKAKLEHYVKVEEALQEALSTARENAAKAQENAEEKAKLIIRDAETRAREIVQKADIEKNTIAQQAHSAVEEAKQSQRHMKHDLAQLGERQHQIVARLRGFLMSEMEMLARFEESDPIGYIKFLPGEQSKLPPGDSADVPQAASDMTPPATPEEEIADSLASSLIEDERRSNDTEENEATSSATSAGVDEPSVAPVKPEEKPAESEFAPPAMAAGASGIAAAAAAVTMSSDDGSKATADPVVETKPEPVVEVPEPKPAEDTIDKEADALAAKFRNEPEVAEPQVAKPQVAAEPKAMAAGWVVKEFDDDESASKPEEDAESAIEIEKIKRILDGLDA